MILQLFHLLLYVILIRKIIEVDQYMMHLTVGVPTCPRSK